MEPAVSFEHGHHVSQLRVLVGLGTVPVAPVDHGLISRALGHTVQLAEVSPRPHRSAAHGVGVARDGSNDDDARVLALLDGRHHEVDEKEVREVVHLQRSLQSIFGEEWLFLGRKIQRGIAHQLIDLAAALELTGEALDGIEVRKLNLLDGVGVLRETKFLGNALGFLDVTNTHDHVMLATLNEGAGRLKTETGGCAGDHGRHLAIPTDGTDGPNVAEGVLKIFDGVHENIARLSVH
mmetsp:Transcript_10235/g.20034  ORF Transcript_10235/g.20034 Transcript_10235/m.20034 type:complete len:237 (-) Transcript_10235:322-1032(-)